MPEETRMTKPNRGFAAERERGKERERKRTDLTRICVCNRLQHKDSSNDHAHHIHVPNAPVLSTWTDKIISIYEHTHTQYKEMARQNADQWFGRRQLLTCTLQTSPLLLIHRYLVCYALPHWYSRLC